MNRTEQIKQGCKVEVKVYSKYKWYSKKYEIKVCGNDGYYCSECQAKLEERKLALKEKQKILEKIRWMYNRDFGGSDKYMESKLREYLDNKISEIKQELEQ